jgi:hypothetical protein
MYVQKPVQKGSKNTPTGVTEPLYTRKSRHPRHPKKSVKSTAKMKGKTLRIGSRDGTANRSEGENAKRSIPRIWESNRRDSHRRKISLSLPPLKAGAVMKSFLRSRPTVKPLTDTLGMNSRIHPGYNRHSRAHLSRAGYG